jgi:hypothetical protein
MATASMEDADAALARALQEEEYAMDKFKQKDQLMAQLQGSMDKVVRVRTWSTCSVGTLTSPCSEVIKKVACSSA